MVKMINGQHKFRVFVGLLTTRSKPYSPIHTHIHTAQCEIYHMLSLLEELNTVFVQDIAFQVCMII